MTIVMEKIARINYYNYIAMVRSPYTINPYLSHRLVPHRTKRLENEHAVVLGGLQSRFRL